MTVKEKQGFGLYFLLAFGLAWLLQGIRFGNDFFNLS